MTDSKSFTGSLDIFFGATSVVESQIYVRALAADGVSLSGCVRGPFCAHADTLPSEFSLQRLDREYSDVLRAIVADPCFWTPESPFLYDVTLNLQADGCTEETLHRQIGIRPLGVDGRHFRYAGCRYVMRLVDFSALTEEFCEPHQLLRACRETGTGLLVPAGEQALADQASREGVLLAARVAGDSEESLVQSLSRLTEWPAVAMVVLDEMLDLPEGLDQRAPNLMFACQRTCPKTPPEWAQVLLVDDALLQQGDLVASTLPQPVLAIKQLAAPTTLGKARQFCDELQRETAHLGDLAGYIVSCRGL